MGCVRRFISHDHWQNVSSVLLQRRSEHQGADSTLPGHVPTWRGRCQHNCHLLGVWNYWTCSHCVNDSSGLEPSHVWRLYSSGKDIAPRRTSLRPHRASWRKEVEREGNQGGL